MKTLWLVVTDEAGRIETAGAYPSPEKASAVAEELQAETGMLWAVRPIFAFE